MSLNGLDGVKVNEAYEAAIAETSGWLLLQYISRDEVDVYKTGTGGSSELREAIGQYEEKSPLYGVLVYRRKKVLLKYVPEGTSRLLQARLAVHMQSIVEKFPHDALLPLENASQLTDSALSSSVSALKTSGSIKSLNSLKKRRLTGIAEDADDTDEAPDIDTQNSTPLDTPTSELADPIPAAFEEEFEQDDNASTSTTKAVQELDETYVGTDSASRPSFDISPETESRPSLAFSETARSVGSKSLNNNSISPISDTFAHLYKPKVKLAPRPVTESRHSSPYVRPTSSLPAGIQVQSREQSTAMPLVNQQQFFRPSHVQQRSNEGHVNGSSSTSVYNSPTWEDRPVSRGSIATVPANVRYTEESTMTPEKKRLMKALQKRKQQQKARQLAKEGKFEDDDRDLENERVSRKGSNKAASSVSARSSSPRKPTKPRPPTQILITEKNKLDNPSPVLSSQAPETPNITTAESDRPRSTIRIVSQSSVEEQRTQTENPDDNREHEALADTAANTLLITDDVDTITNQTTIPPLPMHKFVAFPDAQTVTDTSDAQTDDHPTLPHLEQPVASSPSPPESVDLGLPIEGQSAINVTDSFYSENVAVENDTPLTSESIGLAISSDSVELPKAFNQVLESTDQAPLIPQEEPINVGDQDSQEMHHAAHDEHSVETLEATELPRTSSGALPLLDQTTNIAAIIADTPKQSRTGHSPSYSRDSVYAEETASTHKDAEIQRAEIFGEADSQVAAEPGKYPLGLSREPSSMERRSRPPPITPTVRNSIAHSKAASLSEEDAFFEELQSATVEEATSVTLAKTPTTPFSPTIPKQIETRRGSEASRKTPPFSEEITPPTPALPASTMSLPQSTAQTSKPVSEASISRTVTPDGFGTISRPATRDVQAPFSSAYGNFVPRSRQGSLSPVGPELERPSSRKSAVSSLISQRIKAFEDKFSASSTPQQTPTSAVKAQIVTLRKVSLNTPPSSSHTTSQMSSGRSTPSPYPTPSPSPNNFAQRWGFGKTSKKEETPKPTSTREAVGKLNKGVTDNLPSIAVTSETSLSPPESKSKRSFFSSSKSRKKKTNSVSSTASFKKDGRLSAEASGNQSVTSPRTNSSDSIGRSRSPSSVESLASDGEKKDSKKKAGLLKRLSTMGGGSHRSIAETMSAPMSEQTVKSNPEPENTSKWRSSVTLGDLNIQFPDTLLWKRKHVEIDSQGYLVLVPFQSEQTSKVTLKRYHISEFRKPYIPEPDREELPYSVNLDFLDGSTIQCACESSGGQQRVYQALNAARDAFVVL